MRARRQGLSFWAPKPILPGEDFTVSVSWQKGLITPKAGYYLRYLVLVLLLGGLLLLWLYYWFAWNSVGRDPKARIITQYEPPKGFSAVKMLYIYTQGGAEFLLPTTVVSLAMKDALCIKQEDGLFSKKTFLERKNGLTSPIISPEEAFVYPALFHGKDRIKLADSSNASTFKEIKEQLEAVLKKETEPYFSNHTAYNIPTFVFLAFGVLLCFPWQIESILFTGITLFFWVIITYSLLQKRVSWASKLASSLYLGCFCITNLLTVLTDVWTGIAYAILVVAAIVGGFFMQWIKAYTVMGREVMDHIEGFKQYMEVGEGGRVAQSDPTDALRIFCDYLPYAYALGVESKWMKLFEKQFSSQELNRALSHRGFTGLNPSNFASSMNSAFSSLSSGAGGGGHAGGGSGGGGGGGR